MRYVKVLFLHIQEAFEARSRVIVWLLMSLFNPLIMIFFWKGAKTNVSFSFIVTYYLLFIILGSVLLAHIEVSVAYEDIRQGDLSKHLLKPFSYFMRKLLLESSYRIVQGFFGVIIIFLVLFGFRQFFNISLSPVIILGGLLLSIMGYFVCFTYKMILGLSAFWFTEPGGLLEISDILIFLIGGYIIPLTLFPKTLEIISYILPFSYFIYFPTIAFQGKLSIPQILLVFGVQCLWLGIFAGLYVFLFRKGLKKFSGVGN